MNFLLPNTRRGPALNVDQLLMLDDVGDDVVERALRGPAEQRLHLGDVGDAPSPAQQIDFSDLGRLAELVDRNLGRPANPQPGLFLSEWTIPTSPDREFNFYVEPRVQALWITDALRIAMQVPYIYAVGWIHLYDELPSFAGGLIRADGRKKPGYFAWRSG
jgi:hypothetical protein